MTKNIGQKWYNLFEWRSYIRQS